MPYSSDRGSVNSASSSSEEVSFESELRATLKFNPVRAVDGTDPNDCALNPVYPISFYDRHVDPGLTLKYIETVPLSSVLSMICCTETAQLLSDDSIVKPDDYFAPDEDDEEEKEEGHEYDSAQSLAGYYEAGLLRSFAILPEKQYIHPESELSGSILEFESVPNVDRRVPPRRFALPASLRIGGPGRNLDTGILGLPLELERGLSKEKYAALVDLACHSPELAVWEFYAPNSSGEKLLKARYEEDFSWSVTRTTGCLPPLSTNTLPADGEIVRCLVNGQRKKRSGASRRPAVGVVPARPLPNVEAKGRPYRVDYRHYLQHVWTRAVENDATFIVLSCGTYERIGVRHRASQTLFITDPYRPDKCDTPAYGELHLGLHYAIMKDALERQKLRQAGTPPREALPGKKKRSIDEVDAPSAPERKRTKFSTRAGTRSENITNAIRQALSSRDLALVSVSHGTYHSPSPSSFVRVGPSAASGYSDIPFTKPKRSAKYTPDKYFKITLKERLGSGALADAHCGTVEVEVDGRNVSHPIVMKMVFSQHRSQRKKLEKEHTVYRHLATADGTVEGVLNCYGIFEDTETGALALILDNGGMNLTDREMMDKTKSGVIQPTQAEGEALMRAIRSLHAAGVCHKDIRSDNILVDNTGAAYIIDFDRAKIGPQPDGGFEREIKMMQELVDGEVTTRQSTQYTSSESFY